MSLLLQKICKKHAYRQTHTHTHNAKRPFWNVLLDNLIIFSVSPTTIASATFRNDVSFRLKIFNDILVSSRDTIIKYLELPWWLRHKRNCLQCRKPRFDPWIGRKIPWRKAWRPTPVFLPGESQEPGGLQSMDSRRQGHDRVTNTFTFHCVCELVSLKCSPKEIPRVSLPSLDRIKITTYLSFEIEPYRHPSTRQFQEGIWET